MNFIEYCILILELEAGHILMKITTSKFKSLTNMLLGAPTLNILFRLRTFKNKQTVYISFKNSFALIGFIVAY